MGPKLLSGCLATLNSALDGVNSPPPRAPSADSCPSRIERKLPGGEATLVRAFRTQNKQITLCRTPDDQLYYYGEFIGRPSTGIAMKAEKTTDGYVARNGPYRYTIENGKVTIAENGNTVGQENLTPEPSPN